MLLRPLISDLRNSRSFAASCNDLSTIVYLQTISKKLESLIQVNLSVTEFFSQKFLCILKHLVVHNINSLGPGIECYPQGWEVFYQRSQTSMWLARGFNAAREHRENGDFKRNIGPISLFSQKHWILIQIKFLHFFNAARQTLLLVSARETLWVWDPCVRLS